MKKIFVSYQTDRDRELVGELRAAFARSELAVTDATDVSPGEDLASSVAASIHSSDVVVAILREDAANVFYELGYAAGANRDVLVVVPPTEAIPVSLRSFPHIRSSGEPNETASKIAARVKIMLAHREPTCPREHASVRDRLATYVDDPDYFEAIDAQTFEELLVQWFQERGLVVEVSERGRDLGYDFEVRSPEGCWRAIIEAKKLTRQRKVSASHVMSLIQAAQMAQVGMAILISPSAFTASAAAIAADSGIRVLLKTLKDLLDTSDIGEFFGRPGGDAGS